MIVGRMLFIMSLNEIRTVEDFIRIYVVAKDLTGLVVISYYQSQCYLYISETGCIFRVSRQK